MQIYRASLAALQAPVEERPPTLGRAEVWPYPELDRLWARVEITPFASFPNLAFTVTDPDGTVVCTMYMVEIREPYQSVTLYLRRPPRAGERYTLTIELERDEQNLDTRVLPFDLEYRDPKTAR